MEDSTTSNDANNLLLSEIKTQRSLIISPNLDALLEHEERTRAQTPSMICEMTTSPRSSPSISPSEEFPIGLPPPPRYRRRVKAPCSTNLLLSQARESHEKVAPTPIFVQSKSSSASNPYINPAPTLAELDIPSSVTTKPYINSLSSHGQHSKTPFRSDSHHGSYSGLRLATPHVTKPLSINLNPYSNRNIDALMQNPEDRQRQTRTSVGKPDDMENEDSQARAVANACSTPLDSDSRRRRPLISHANRPSTSPPSPDSTNTFSSHEPATTTENENEHRISISSTIYPPSSTHSHSHSLYNDPVLSLTETKENRDSNMAFYSPSNTEFDLDSTSIDCPQLSPIQFSKLSLSKYSLLSEYSSEYSPPLISLDAPLPCSSKPTLPTTKPLFYRTPMKSGFSRQVSPILTECLETGGAPLPPTTNFLDAEERADLIRKTRKLARVFGQTPRMADQETCTRDASLSATSQYFIDLDWPILRRRPRSALQLSVEPPLLDGPRRHSLPLSSPDDMSFMTDISSSFEGHLSPSSSNFPMRASSDLAGHHAKIQIGSESPISFINFSVDNLNGGDIPFVIPEADKIVRPLPSTTVQSQFEKMLEEQQADEDRRRKRERLAKLHRFLGSRVPANLVLGIDNLEASLPPPHSNPTSPSPGSADYRKNWLRRRSSLAVLPSPCWPNGFERVKEELDEKEKLINVRRAVKMEKVFGVAPPQTLYHTRHCSPTLLLANNPAPEVGRSFSPSAPTSPIQSNPSRSTYIKYKQKKTSRPGTSDSNIQLLPKCPQTSDDLENAPGTHSIIYNHYQYSLNSLRDILDRDDRESLVELHQYLSAGENPSPQLEVPPVAIGRRMSNTSFIKPGRRRSLPARTSISSDYSVTTPEPNITTFQVRRRRAAKLTQFFGVDYRELIIDILQSIENGVEHEHENGTLRTEEVEDLLAGLRNLKTKPQSFLCMK